MHGRETGVKPGQPGETVQAPSAMATPPRLSDDLGDLGNRYAEGAPTMHEIEMGLKGRGFALLIILLALPFCLPVTIPGLGLPVGLAIGVMGLRIAIGRKPWLPGFILRRRIPHRVLLKSLAAGEAAARKMERLVRPRMPFLHRWEVTRRFTGLMIAVSGLMLCLPLPIPLTNTIPAIAVVVLAAGMMEKDGLVILAGYIIGISALGYLVFLFFLGILGLGGTFDLFRAGD